MKKNILLPDSNVFEEKSKQFFESKRAHRLQQKYSSSPYEDEYKPLYYLAIIGSYLCNGISILTASTWLFSYVFSIVKDLPYPSMIAVVVAGIVLLLLEVLQRVFGAKVFRFRSQYNKTLYGVFIGASMCAMVSLVFSFLGGFDVVKTVTSPPLYKAPILEDVKAVERSYQALVDDAQQTADNYYNRRKYKGRIATEDAQKYQQYLDKKIMYQDSLLAAVTAVKQRNEQKLATTNAEHTAALVAYQASTESKGAGLGGIALISAALLYVCLWYIEYYDFKTASQYVVVSQSSNSSPIPELETIGSPLQELMQEIHALRTSVQEIEQQQNILPPSLDDTSVEQEVHTPPHSSSQPIGFRRNAERTEAPVSPIMETKASVHACTDVYNDTLMDRYTIEHIYTKAGKEVRVRYTLAQVNARINQYERELQDAQRKQLTKDIITNRRAWLTYWVQRKKELLEKVDVDGAV